jgi:hypothetical protein
MRHVERLNGGDNGDAGSRPRWRFFTRESVNQEPSGGVTTRELLDPAIDLPVAKLVSRRRATRWTPLEMCQNVPSAPNAPPVTARPSEVGMKKVLKPIPISTFDSDDGRVDNRFHASLSPTPVGGRVLPRGCSQPDARRHPLRRARYSPHMAFVPPARHLLRAKDPTLATSSPSAWTTWPVPPASRAHNSAASFAAPSASRRMRTSLPDAWRAPRRCCGPPTTQSQTFASPWVCRASARSPQVSRAPTVRRRPRTAQRSRRPPTMR